MEEIERKLFYSPGEFREILGCSKHLVYESLRQGLIKNFRLGSRYFIPATEIERLQQVTDGNSVEEKDS